VKGVVKMKDVLKLMGMYFAVGFGTIAGIGTGMKVCDKLLSTKSVKEEPESKKIIKFVKESE
jgi:hypothetical protein